MNNLNTRTLKMHTSINDNLEFIVGVEGKDIPIKIGKDLLKSYLDITALETTVDTVVPTTTTVSITSAEILNIGSAQITLLEAPGAGIYYDNIKITLEYTYGTAAYNNGGGNYLVLWDGTSVLHDSLQLNGKTTNLISIWTGDISEQVTNRAIYLTTAGGLNPTLGDGTIRAIIEYTTKTFGA